MIENTKEQQLISRANLFILILISRANLFILIKTGLLRWGRGHCFQIIEIENLSAKLLLKSTAQAATFSSVALKACSTID